MHSTPCATAKSGTDHRLIMYRDVGSVAIAVRLSDTIHRHFHFLIFFRHLFSVLLPSFITCSIITINPFIFFVSFSIV